MKHDHEAIFCIINAGFSETAMEAAREYGASGGTVLRARGTANPEAERLFNITIQPEKEIVMIVCKSELKDGILHGLYRAVGFSTPGHGIVFSMPVDGTVGIKDSVPEKPAGEQNKEK